MEDTTAKITVQWKGNNIELLVPPEHLEIIIAMVMELVHENINNDGLLEPLDELLEEEKHLRSQLFQYNRNRRKFETKVAHFGSNDVPIHVMNELEDTEARIKELEKRIQRVSTKIRHATT